MESEDWIGCGHASHDTYCLCDVVITNPLPPVEDCIRDGVTDLWMGKELCDIKGYCLPWDNQKILDYLVDLRTFYDAWHDNQRTGIQAKHLEEMEPVMRIDDEPWPSYWGRVREAFQYAMDRFDHCPTSIIKHLCLTPQALMEGLTTGKCGDGWTEERIKELDTFLMEENLNFRAISRDSNLTVAVINGLRKYWDARRNRTGKGSDNPARERMHWLARNTKMKPRVIVDIVHQEYGFVYAPSSISKYRRRLNGGE